MQTDTEKDFLYLIWKDPRTRKNFTVGKLTRGETYIFQYCEEYTTAKKYGWRGLQAFPEEKVYESKTLFPVFSSRVPDPKRRDIEKILAKYGLKKFDAYDLLKKNGGRLPIDTYEFINPIFGDDEKIRQEFFVMGVRHSSLCGGKDCALLPKVAVGDFLILEPEPENEEDSSAIRIMTNAGEKLGYVPRYYNQVILERLSRGITYSCHVTEVNRSKICSECIKVCLNMPSIK